MKLYYYDEKHQVVFDHLDLGGLDFKQKLLLEKIIKFIGDKVIDGRYKALALADSYKMVQEEGENYIEFWNKPEEQKKESNEY